MRVVPSAAPAPRSALAELDELARSESSQGFTLVRGERAVLEALGRHVDRRARAAGRAVIHLGGFPTDDAWRALCDRMAIAACTDPVEAARALIERAHGAVVVVLEGAPTSWGRALGQELADLLERDASGTLVIALRDEASSEPSPRLHGAAPGRVVDAAAHASADDLKRWWDAIAQDADRQVGPSLDRLDVLEAWWSAARATPVDARTSPIELGAAAHKLVARLALARRSIAMVDVMALGASAAAIEELVSKRVAIVDERGRIALVSSSAEIAVDEDVDPADAQAVAAVLATRAGDDAWALARASELYALASEPDLAEAAAVRAIEAVTDAAARADFWSRWQSTLGDLDDAGPRLLRAADLALKVGDVDRALDFARAGVGKLGDGFETMLVLGRATTARGDLVTAIIALEKAVARAPNVASRAHAAVELAEAHYQSGDLATARKHADDAARDAGDLETRLHARNVLGKLHLAASAWQEAERHFAADACDAACAGDVTAELRARLNRSIALLSSGRRDEARAMLLVILDEAERRRDLRAMAFAFTNLATIAMLKQAFGEALELSERAIEVQRRLGEKVGLARLIANLAELRLSMGLLPEAEQALAFGRAACSQGLPGSRASHFALVAARIHLERGATIEANGEIAAAIAAAASASDGRRLGDCFLVQARIALEDGDVARASRSIEEARATVSSPAGAAELALVEACRARAAGEPFAEIATSALELARRADSSELAREAHVLLHHAAIEAGAEAAGRDHLDAALLLRDRAAAGLSEDHRRRYFARRELVDLARLEASARLFEEVPRSLPIGCDRCGRVECEGCRRPSDRPVANAAPRRIVGKDPAIVALLGAIQKVGASDATVLIQGESGTGKELVAEAIHEASPRKSGPLVKVNCAALVETLLLSELFGHEKGSFTGAAARRRGRFELAEGGTLFLDEIGDISPRTQVALLRVLQEKTFERVGGVTPIRANVRIVCATHRDLRAMVARGEFREDLYYRLRGLVLEVPALRTRLGDLGAIASAILARVAGERGTPARRLSARALDGLSRHPWPGNVRELDNALRAAALFAESEILELEDFTANVDGLRGLIAAAPPSIPTILPSNPTLIPPSMPSGMRPAFDFGQEGPATMKASRNELPVVSEASTDGAGTSANGAGGSPTEVAYAAIRAGISLSDMKRQIERECIARALAESGGNITRAAGLLGMKRPRLSQLVKQYGFGNGDGADSSDVEVEDAEEN